MSCLAKGCLAPLRALQRHWPGSTRHTGSSLDAASKKAVEAVLLSVANASSAGVDASSRVQKLHDRLHAVPLDDACPMSRRKLASSLARLQAEYEATRTALRASALRSSKDWLMGVERADAVALARLYARIEAATAVIHSAGTARAELATTHAGPAAC